MTEMRALTVSETFHGFRQGDRLLDDHGRLGTVAYVGLEAWTREFGMHVEYESGVSRFYYWNSWGDVAEVKLMEKM